MYMTARETPYPGNVSRKRGNESLSGSVTAPATKQETTKRLRTLLAEGRKLATFLRAGVKQRYGNRAEKLVEFGLAPLRPKVRTPDATKIPVTPPTPNPATN